MSVLIKGKMPDNCGQCFAYDTTYRVCNLYFMGIPNRMTSLEHRPEWCELVELQSHGRLIDADALIDDGWLLIKSSPYFRYTPTSICYGSGVVTKRIADAPTILEAEVEE